jgi:hypothetical protein
VKNSATFRNILISVGALKFGRTFLNGLEYLLVAWSRVLLEKMSDEPV